MLLLTCDFDSSGGRALVKRTLYDDALDLLLKHEGWDTSARGKTREIAKMEFVAQLFQRPVSTDLNKRRQKFR